MFGSSSAKQQLIYSRGGYTCRQFLQPGPWLRHTGILLAEGSDEGKWAKKCLFFRKSLRNIDLAKINTVNLCLLQRPLKAMKHWLHFQFSRLDELVLYLSLSCQARFRRNVSTDCWWQKLVCKGTAQVQTVKEKGFNMEVTLKSQLFEIFCLKYRPPCNTMAIHWFFFSLCDFLIYMFAFLSMF